MRLTKRFVAATAVLVLAATSCGGGEKADEPKPTTTSTSTTEATTTTTEVPAAPVIAPLLGTPAPDPALATRPALAIKVGNDKVAMPHQGINRADLVVEIQVEGISRMMAVFQSQDATEVGGTRSARYSDPDILAMFGKPLFGWSGANENVTARILSIPWVKNVHWNAVKDAYWRSKAKHDPYNLMTDTTKLYAHADPDQTAPQQIFQYLAAGEANPGELPMPGFALSVGTTPSRWAWDAASSRWLRWEYGVPHATNEGQVWADNVVVLQTQYGKGSVANSLGTGQAWVMSGGTVLLGTWTRADRTYPYTLTTLGGEPIKLRPGRTWIELPTQGPDPIDEQTAAGMLNGVR